MNEINIEESMPLLLNVLNISGFQKKYIKKNKGWIYGKINKKEFYTCAVGFTQQDVELIQVGIQGVAAFCEAHLLKLPSECNDRDIYMAYAAKTIKELRSLISMSYICEHYCSFTLRSMQAKVRGDLTAKGYPQQLSDKNVQEINTGIRAVAELLSNMRLTL